MASKVVFTTVCLLAGVAFAVAAYAAGGPMMMAHRTRSRSPRSWATTTGTKTPI